MRTSVKATPRRINLLFVALIIVSVITLNFLMISVVHGKSMEPTFMPGDVLISRRHSTFHAGDIVIIESNNTKGLDDGYIVKRVIAEGGDTLLISNGEIKLNGKMIEEPYILEKWDVGNFKGSIPNDSLYVMGDNRNHSYDSREIGLISIKDVKSKVLFKLPINLREGFK